MVKELTLRQRRERGLRAAEVAVQPSDMAEIQQSEPVMKIYPVRPSPSAQVANQITPDMEFAALNSGKVKETFSSIEGEAGGATNTGIVRHRRADTVIMYKPDAYGHYSPRQVSANSIAQN